MSSVLTRPVVAKPPQSPPFSSLGAEHVSALHWEAISRPRWPQEAAPAPPGTLHYWVAENHRCNGLLWAGQEPAGRARCRGDGEDLQRELEDCNRKRNQAIDALDAALVEAAERIERRGDAPPSGETAGALIDRLSINALQIFHLGRHLQQPGAWETEFAAGADQLSQWRLQRARLMQELDALLRGIVDGEFHYRPQRQFKACEDPGLDLGANRFAS